MKKIFSLFVAALFCASMMADADTYTVVGDGCGLSWDQTSSTNDMALDGSVYKLIKTDMELLAGTINYKIVKNHSWAVSYPQDGNASFSIAKSGKYDVTFTLDLSATPAYSAVAELKEEVDVIPAIKMHGNFTGSWANTDAFALAGDKKTASLTLTLAKASYQFGMRIGSDDNWTSNGSAFTRDAASHAITAGSGNNTLAADAAGEYTFTWTFETNTLSVTYPAAPVDPEPEAKFYITGDSALVVDAGLTADKQWNPDAIKSEKDTFVLNLKAGQYYKLKVAVNGTWIGENNVKGYNELSEKTDGLKDEGNDHNIGFTLKTAGAVQVIYKAGDPELFKVLGDFVVPDPEELPEVSVAGDFNGWTASAGVMTPAGDKKTASITVNLNKVQNWGFKVICGGKWLSNGAEGVEYKRGDAAKTAKYEGGEGNNIFIVADIAGDYTITWNYEDSTVAVAFPELPEITLEDGYYLVGIAGWSIYSLSAAEKFAANPGQEGEYMLANVTLALNDEFKVVEVQNKAFTANWYGSGGEPAGSANFKVTEDFVGKATIYFKPVLDESWNGHIWVAMEGQTALDNTQVGEKAVKMIENGQLVILKNGVRYSVLGVRVK